jgi:DNA gyrase subunit A
MICVNRNEPEKTVLVVSEKGFGKRTSIDEYRITNRGGKGVKTINITEKTGKLVGMLDVSEKEDLIITCKSGITLRTALSSIKESGRATQGVRLIRLDEGDEIAAISKVDQEEEQPKEEDVLTENNETNGQISEEENNGSTDNNTNNESETNTNQL